MAPPLSEFWQYVAIVGQASGLTGCSRQMCSASTNTKQTTRREYLRTWKTANSSKATLMSQRSGSQRTRANQWRHWIALKRLHRLGSTDVSSKYSRSRTGLAECRILTKAMRHRARLGVLRWSSFPVHRKSTLAVSHGTTSVRLQAAEQKELNNQLLDDCYSSLQAEMSTKCQKPHTCSLATDAWTNVNGEWVINFIVLLPGQCFMRRSTLPTTRIRPMISPTPPRKTSARSARRRWSAFDGQCGGERVSCKKIARHV